MDKHHTPAMDDGAEKQKRTQDPNKGNKRLFSEAYEPEPVQAGNYVEAGSHPAPNTAEKRHRASRWPFHSKDNEETATDKRRGRRFGGSGAGKRTPKRNPRSSRFVEGSMNNRASKKPPQEYFASYESNSQSEKDESASASRQFRQPSQAAMMLRDQDETDADTAANRQSGIFKFGTKLAATFNPTKWKIWQKEKPVEDSSVAERLKADAEFKRAYEEVKKRGFIQGNRPGALASAERSQNQLYTNHNKSDTVMKESGVESADEESYGSEEARTGGHSNITRKPHVNTPHKAISQSELESKYQRPFPRTPIKLPAVTPQDSVSNYSPSSTSPRRGPSLLLQGAFNDNPWRPTMGRIVDPQPSEGRPQALPKKEMDKQLNLVKKVSTLEFKLRRAQEELALAMGTPLPPPKTRIGIDYEAIHAIQVQYQQQNGPDSIKTTASAFFQKRKSRPSHGAEHKALNAEDSGSSKRDSKTPGTNLNEIEPAAQLSASYSEEPAHPAPRLEANYNGAAEGALPQAETVGREHTPSVCSSQLLQDPNEDNIEDAELTTSEVTSLKRIKSGPKRHNVAVSTIPDGLSKIRSLKGRVETERGRPLRRSGDGRDIAVELPSLASNRSPSAGSVKSTRSSRIPRPRSRAGTPVRGMAEAPPVPSVPAEKLEQVQSGLKKSRSTKSVKAAQEELAVKGAGQLSRTPPRRDRSESMLHAGRRKSAGAGVAQGNADGLRGETKSPSRERAQAVRRDGSVKGGARKREREMSPSKEGTFEWGPEVF